METNKSGAVAVKNDQSRMVTVGEVQLELLEGGTGEPVVILHGIGGLNEWQPYQTQLAQRYRVMLPSHPGFGRSSRPDWLDTISDVALFYEDFLEVLNLQNVHLVGCSMGGWIAAELAVRSCERLKSLTLIDAVGIKISEPQTRDIADIFAMSDEAKRKLIWHNPEMAKTQKTPADPDMSDEIRAILFRNVETAALMTWKPFLHNPKLRHWLHRIHVPTHVIWGEQDGVVSAGYGKAYADLIPGARFTVIGNAAHVPQLEQPDRTVAALVGFWSEL